MYTKDEMKKEKKRVGGRNTMIEIVF